MRNRILFEFEDQPWFPGVIRSGMTDYLRYFFTVTDFYAPALPFLNSALDRSRSKTIIDLCSGAGGPLPIMAGRLDADITLTDLYPNKNAGQYLAKKSAGRLHYIQTSVDATNTPRGMPGVRTMFSAIHHFSSGGVRAILQDAVNQRQAVAIFDGGDRSIITILGILFAHPVGFFVLTPFFRPFKFSRLLFTYLLPVIPLCTIWDGIVSILRLHQPESLIRIARNLSGESYDWQTGKVRNKFGFRISYLVGTPASDDREKIS